jgi:chromosome segregation ATPase
MSLTPCFCAQVAESGRTLDTLQKQIRAVDAASATLTSDATGARAVLASKHATLAAVTERLQTAQQRCADLRASIANTEQRQQRVEGSMNQAQQTLEQQHRELDQAQAQQTALQASLQQVLAQIQNITNEIAIAQQRYA